MFPESKYCWLTMEKCNQTKSIRKIRKRLLPYPVELNMLMEQQIIHRRVVAYSLPSENRHKR